MGLTRHASMKAMFLIAGRGRRLRPYTDTQPKCMVPLHGEPLLSTALHMVGRVGIQHAVLVVGHMEDIIREAYGDSFAGVELSYISNPDYATTNNLYTMWLAREALNDDLVLLEGDLRYDIEVLQRLVEHPAENVAVVDDFRPPMNGTVVLPSATNEGWAQRMVLGKDQGEDFPYAKALKTVNLYKLSRTLLQSAFVPALDEAVRGERTGDYYEAVLAQLVDEGKADLAYSHVESSRWAEVDNEEDLRFALELFKP